MTPDAGPRSANGPRHSQIVMDDSSVHVVQTGDPDDGVTGARHFDRGRFWRDANGKVVVAQVPNVPLVGWLLFTGLSWFPGAEGWKNGTSFASSAFLFTWAYLELTHGASYFRRLLGLVVLAAVVEAHFH